MVQETSVNTQRTRNETRDDDRPLWDVAFAVFGYPALLIAHRLKVFPLLANGALTLEEISDALNIKQRPAEAI